MCPFDFRTSFSGLSQEGWEMELEWVGVEDSGAVGLVGMSHSETNEEGVTSHPRRSPFPATHFEPGPELSVPIVVN